VRDVQLAPGARRRPRAAPARDVARLLHQLLEALVVNRQALLGKQLLGHLVGEAVGVVEAEGVLGRNPGRLLLLRLRDQLGEQPLALVQRPSEALLLGPRPALDGRPLALQLGIDAAHHLDHAPVQLREEGPLDPQHVTLAHRAAHDPAQDVAALFVRGHDAVGEQEGAAATVVGEHAERPGGGRVLAPGAAGALLAELDQRPQLVRLEHGRHALLDRRHALDP
jgi:hypothetical protein